MPERKLNFLKSSLTCLVIISIGMLPTVVNAQSGAESINSTTSSTASPDPATPPQSESTKSNADSTTKNSQNNEIQNRSTKVNSSEKRKSNTTPAKKIDTSKRWRVWANLQYDRIDSIDSNTDASATLLTELSPVLGAQWIKDFKQGWAYGAGAQLSFMTFQKNVSSNSRVIKNTDQLHFLGYLDFTRLELDRAKTRFILGLQERIFQHTDSQTDIILDKVKVPFLKAERRSNIFDIKKGDIGLGGSVTYLHSSKTDFYKVNSGYGFGFFADMNFFRTTTSVWNAQLYYNLEKQNSDILDQKNTHIGFQFSYLGAL